MARNSADLSKFIDANFRRSDEHMDMLEAEFPDSETKKRKHDYVWTSQLSSCWDEKQAWEIIAAESTWVLGERFYDLTRTQWAEDDWDQFDVDEFVKSMNEKENPNKSDFPLDGRYT